MTSESPKVTIGIPTFNRAASLPQAIASAVAQTYVNIEIIVSDNASVDNTQELLAGYKEKIIVLAQQENIGMTRNWDACLASATGEFFLLLSDDDYLEPNAVEQLVSGYNDRPETKTFVYGRTLVHKSDGSFYSHSATPPDCENGVDYVMNCFMNRRFSPTGATLFKTVDLRTVGGYWADNFNLAPDSSIMMKTALLDPKRYVKFVDVVVFNYRIHASNLTSGTKLNDWADELVRLSNIVLKQLMIVAPSDCRKFIMWRDRYVVTFILSQAVEFRPRSYIERCKRVLYCYRTCLPCLGVHSLKTFCFWAVVLVFPFIARLKPSVGRAD